MTRVALGDLRAHPVRLLATALSVVLGTAFVAGTFILTDMARAAFDHLFAAGGAHADVVVRPVGDLEGQVREGAAVPDRVVDAVAAVDGVAAVAAVHEGPALLLGPDGEPLVGPGFGGPPSAVSWIAEDALRDQVLRTGRAPAGAGEVAVADAIAADQGLALGDEVRLVFGNAVVDARVVGTFSYDEGGGGGTDVGTLGGWPSVALDAGAAAEHLGGPASLRVLAADGVDSEGLAAAIARALDGVGDAGGPDESARFEVLGGAAVGQDTGGRTPPLLRAMTTGLLAFAGVSLLVAGAGIFNTFTITVAQRTREFALLRALGASRGQVAAAVLVEAAIVGAAASAVGVVAGFGLAAGLRVLLDAFGLALPAGELVLRPRTAVVAVGLGVAVSVLAALLPAVRANRVPPVQALRDHSVSPAAASAGGGRARVAAGALAGVAGIAALAAEGFTDGGLPLLGTGALGALLALALLGPGLTTPAASAIGAPIAALRGLPGELARANAARNPARTASTAAALMIGLGLVSATLILTASLQASVGRLDETPDFQVFSGNFVSFPEAAAGALADVEWAASVTAIKSARIGIAGTAHSAVGIQPATFRDVLGVRVLAGHLDALAQDTASGDAATGENLTRDAAAGESPTRDAAAGESPTRDATAGASPTRDTSAGETAIADRSAGDARIALGADLAAELGIGVGDRVPVTFAGSGEAAGETPARVVAIFDPDSLVLAAPALVSYDRLAAAAPHAGDTGAFVALADGVTVDRARPALRAALADFPTAQLLDADAVTARVQSGANQLLGLVFGLLFLSIVIALFGITNTLGLSVLERTRELGLLRAVGMTRAQTRAMVRWESVIVAVLGGLLGLAVGGLFGWVAVRALPAEFEAFAFPAGRLLAAAAVAVLAGVLAAVIPARRASRIDVLRAVTVE